MHVVTAGAIADIKPDQVTQAQRTAAKPINFGSIYGMSAKSLVASVCSWPWSTMNYSSRYWIAGQSRQTVLVECMTEAFIETFPGAPLLGIVDVKVGQVVGRGSLMKANSLRQHIET